MVKDFYLFLYFSEADVAEYISFILFLKQKLNTELVP